jgi:hypothetical protein
MLYRVRQQINRSYFSWRTRVILSTPPLSAAPDAACAIHTMLSQRDVPMYLPAIKSLLRHAPPVRVVVHSDGSLDADAVALVRRHVPGATIVAADDADRRAASALGTESYLFRWRRHDASWRRVIDTELWCETPRRIVVDPDVIVLHRPDALVDWIAGGDRPFLFGQPPTPGSPAGSPGFIQTIFRERIRSLAARLNLPAEFPQGATSGFYGCGRELSLASIERVLRAGEAEGFPMAQWGSEQCTVIYLLQASGGTRLDPLRYLNYDPTCDPLLAEACAVHFYGTYRYHRGIYPRLAARIAAGLQHADRSL